MENQCAVCIHGSTLRIHVLSGNRNCEKGEHMPSGECSDFEKVKKYIITDDDLNKIEAFTREENGAFRFYEWKGELTPIKDD
jgi:hypothetical protein